MIDTSSLATSLEASIPGVTFTPAAPTFATDMTYSVTMPAAPNAATAAAQATHILSSVSNRLVILSLLSGSALPGAAVTAVTTTAADASPTWAPVQTAANHGPQQIGRSVWLGTSTFGHVAGSSVDGLIATSNNAAAARRANIRPEPHRIQVTDRARVFHAHWKHVFLLSPCVYVQSESMHANPVMSSPDVILDAGGGNQMVFVAEGESFEYTVALAYPPGTTKSNDVIDDKRDTVHIWLTSSQGVMQEESPGEFVQHLGHRTQLVISTAGASECLGLTTCTGSSESRWIHGEWSVDADSGHSLSFTRLEPGGGTTQSDGEALLVFNSSNWYVNIPSFAAAVHASSTQATASRQVHCANGDSSGTAG
jgi:hypothetical protein